MTTIDVFIYNESKQSVCVQVFNTERKYIMYYVKFIFIF